MAMASVAFTSGDLAEPRRKSPQRLQGACIRTTNAPPRPFASGLMPVTSPYHENSQHGMMFDSSTPHLAQHHYWESHLSAIRPAENMLRRSDKEKGRKEREGEGKRGEESYTFMANPFCTKISTIFCTPVTTSAKGAEGTRGAGPPSSRP